MEDARAAPEKIMLEFLGTGFLETVNLATLRVDTGHDMPNGAVLSGANEIECSVSQSVASVSFGSAGKAGNTVVGIANSKKSK